MFSGEVRGLGALERLGREFRDMGDQGKGFRRELHRGLNSATKGVRAELKEAIPDALPQRGGLAAEIQSAARFNTSAKTSGKFLGVTIWGKAKGHDLRTLRGKRLRHPVYGNRSTWVNQTAGVDPTAVPDKFQAQTPAVRRAVLDSIATVQSKLYRSAK